MLKRKRSPQLNFSESDKHLIIRDYLESGETKAFIWEKYTGRQSGAYQISRMMMQLGYQENASFAIKASKMKPSRTSKAEESFEIEKLKHRIAELEKQVSDSEMKASAFSTMVDLAEKEFKISIRKKYNTKPLKK